MVQILKSPFAPITKIYIERSLLIYILISSNIEDIRQFYNNLPKIQIRILFYIYIITLFVMFTGPTSDPCSISNCCSRGAVCHADTLGLGGTVCLCANSSYALVNRDQQCVPKVDDICPDDAFTCGDKK